MCVMCIEKSFDTTFNMGYGGRGCNSLWYQNNAGPERVENPEEEFNQLDFEPFLHIHKYSYLKHVCASVSSPGQYIIQINCDYYVLICRVMYSYKGILPLQ